MFQKALIEAMGYTRPVVISARYKNGETESSIATSVILNDQGWLLTASHVVESMQKLERSRTYNSKVCQIRRDTSISREEQKKKIKALGTRPQNPVTDCSVWWGDDKWKAEFFHINKAADLAIGKLSDFDGDSVSNYPVFKNPSVNFHPGESLCKLGFPFSRITPEYDEKNGNFILPPGAIPLPLFPLEGIFTRIIVAEGRKGNSVQFVETSSPGLRGQSGGPTLDVKGRIWALQSKTVHYSLDFSPRPPGGKNKEHQFIGLGVGVHSKIIIEALQKFNIRHEVSAD